MNLPGMYVLMIVLAIPLVLTFLNVVQLFHPRSRLGTAVTEGIGIVLGAVCLMGTLAMENVTSEMWYTEIFEIDRYPPYDVSRTWQILLLAALGGLGWLFLRILPPEKQPPLATVLAFTALYAVTVEMVLYLIQIAGCDTFLFVLLYAFNLFVILAKLIREQVAYRRTQPVKEGLQGLSRLLESAYALPVLGFALLALVIGLLLVILILCGQSPDELTALWTNTAEWNLSLRTPPPKVPYDGHYLCTVAAKGHPKLVKPLRTGKRNGHTVLVNRQLMIANAFEDLIREHTPRFHHAVRSFYDKTGFPLSRYIGTPLKSDLTYLLMKPLEWIFLGTLYLFDPKPENRIAVQYLP